MEESRTPRAPESREPGSNEQTIETSEGAVASRRVIGDDEKDRLAPGTKAGNYVIEGVVGSGGGGIVYSGRHLILQRRAAIKVLRRHLTSSPVMMARFVREASAVHLIGHPNIVDVYEFDELPDGRPFYVMELVEGTNLRTLLNAHGGFSPAEVLDVLEPICEALAAVHEAGIVHRDLKASNVLVVDKEDGRRTIKLLDFGVAKLLHPEPGEEGLTGPGMILGSVHTMSPEQILGEPVDARSDVYSLGVLLFQLLTGAIPFSGRPEDVATMHLSAPRPKPSERAAVPPSLDAVVTRSMERDKERRHPSVVAFLEHLRQAVLTALSAEGSPNTPGPAIGLYVEIRVDSIELDDALLDDMNAILDLCEDRLHAAGFSLPVKNANAVLGIKPVRASEQESVQESARKVARALVDELKKRPNRDPRIRVIATLHVDLGIFRELAGDLDVVGGRILRFESWAPRGMTTDSLVLSDAFRGSK